MQSNVVVRALLAIWPAFIEVAPKATISRLAAYIVIVLACLMHTLRLRAVCARCATHSGDYSGGGGTIGSGGGTIGAGGSTSGAGGVESYQCNCRTEVQHEMCRNYGGGGWRCWWWQGC